MKLILEYGYWKSVLVGLSKEDVEIHSYTPLKRTLPKRVLPVTSAWDGIESILGDLIERFDIKTNKCLEFGVEHGYSTSALSSFFSFVTGVDTFMGDRHTKSTKDIYVETQKALAPFDNIELHRSNYQEWIKNDSNYYDLIHVDIIHTYADTFACGLWSALHSKCTIFHDTESFPEVKQAVRDIARGTGKDFYNFAESNGLGIIV